MIEIFYILTKKRQETIPPKKKTHKVRVQSVTGPPGQFRWAPVDRPSPTDPAKRGVIQGSTFLSRDVWTGVLGGSSQDGRKWLGAGPPFISHETALWKGNNLA